MRNRRIHRIDGAAESFTDISKFAAENGSHDDLERESCQVVVHTNRLCLVS